MALRIQNLSTKGTQDDLLEKLLLQYGKQSQPKVGVFNRILAPLTGVGSAIDAYYDAKFEDKNTGILNLLKNYGKNVLQGFGTLATGKSYENLEGMSELLDKTNPAWKYSGIGASPWGRMGVDVAAGLLTDPLTYASFGATALKPGVVDDVLRGVTGGGVSDDIIKAIASKGGTIDDATKAVLNTLGQETADQFYKGVLSQVGKDTAKKGALKFLGQTVTESPKAVKAAKWVVDPLSSSLGLMDKGAAKFAPKARNAMLEMFNPKKLAEESGVAGLADIMEQYNRQKGSVMKTAAGQLQEAGIINSYKNVPKEYRGELNELIEKSLISFEQGEEAQELLKRKDEIIPALEQFMGDYPTTTLEDIFPEERFAISRGRPDQMTFDDMLLKMKPGFGESTGMWNVDQFFDPDEYGYWDGKKLPIREYLKKAKGKEATKVLMSPDKYLEEASKASLVTDNVEGFIKNKSRDKETIEYLKKLLENKTRVDMPWLEYGSYEKVGFDSVTGQEGAHRALAAKALGMDEIPVMVEYSTKGIPSILGAEKGQYTFDSLKSLGLEDLAKKADIEQAPIDELMKTLSPTQQDIITKLLSEKGGYEGNFEKYIGNLTGKKGIQMSLPEDVPDSVRKFLEDYTEFQAGKTGQLQKLGLPVIDPREQGYLHRAPEAVKERFLDKYLRKELGREGVDKLMQDKRIIKELEKDGQVSIKTLRKVLGEDATGLFKKYDLGEFGQALSGGGATKDRIFKTFEQAKAAGLVYSDEPIEGIFKQTIRQDEQMLAAKAVSDMMELKRPNGAPLFLEKPQGVQNTPVTIPNFGQMYTDSKTAKIAEDYVAKFTKDEGLETIMTQFDKAQSYWKRWVTGEGPNVVGYHARNAIDDNIRMVLDGHNVARLPEHYSIADDLFKYEELAEKVGFEEANRVFDSSRVDQFYKRMGMDVENGAEKLWRDMIENGVYADVTQSTSQMGKGVDEILGELTGVSVGKRPDWYEKILTLDGKLPKREQASRIAHYLDTFEKTGSVSEGVEAVKRVLFNYNELTKAEQQVFKRIIPFYGFAKNNLLFYLETLKDNPEKLARFSNVIEGLQSGSQSLYGEEWEAMPDYMKEQFAVPFGKTPEGELKVFGGLRPSFEALSDFMPNQWGNLLGPAPTMGVEAMTGKDMFTGQELMEMTSGGRYRDYPQWMKDLLGYKEFETGKAGQEYTKRMVSPERRYIFEGLPGISNLFTSIGRTGAALNQEEPWDKIRDLTRSQFPAKIYKQNIEDALEMEERGKYDELYKLLQRKGIADVYKSFYIPKGLREELLK
jgi:hypothetical protein